MHHNRAILANKWQPLVSRYRSYRGFELLKAKTFF